MESADRPPLRPGPSLVAVVALSATALVIPVPAPPAATDAGTPPAATDSPVPTAPSPAPEMAIPRPVSRVGPGNVDTGPYPPPYSTPHPASAGIPANVHLAYARAAAELATTRPGCRLPVTLLAAIGRVESGHARGGQVDARGTTFTPILGPRLDGGPGLAAIPDTDGGAHDGDAVWDRAVGPMQFIPGTWRTWAADGNGDGAADPHNVHDAALAAGGYLCADGRDLSTEEGLRAGVLSYNRSEFYLSLVRQWMAVYERGVVLAPVSPARGADDSGSVRAADPPPATREPERPPAERPGSPADPTERPDSPPEPTDPAPPPPAGAPAEPEPPTLAGVVDETLCVVDGIVVSVTTTATGLLGGLLGRDVTAAAVESCEPAR